MNLLKRHLTLSILLPVHDEEINVVIMLRVLGAVLDSPHEILIIHDDPNDRATYAVQKYFPNSEHIRLIHNQRGRGVSNAIQSGIDHAKGDVILLFAVDEVGPILAIKDMMALIEQGCDFVSCTRYAHGGRRLGGSFIGGTLSRVANRLFKLFSGSQLSDATTGIKMFRKSFANMMKFESAPVGWSVAFEMAIKAELSGSALGEVPIVSIDRLYGGKSSFRLWSWISAYMRWFIWGLLKIRGEKISRPSLQVRVPKWDSHYFEKD